MKLKQIQKEFAAHLYDQHQNKIFSIVNKNKAPTEKYLQIYRNNIFGNFDNVLEMIYPTVKKLVGDDYFNQLATLYHQQYRSPTGNLDDYGKYFYKIISTLQPRLKNESWNYLKDIARLEWLYHYAYFAKDVAPIDLIKLQNLKPQQYYKIKFKLHPSCYLLASKYPTYTIWNLAVKNSKKKIDTGKKSAEFILVERSNLGTNIWKLTEEEFLFLQNIKSGKNIYQIYQILNKINSHFDMGSLVAKYIANGVLYKMSFE